MTIHVKPHLEAVLKAQVDAGHYPDVEAALEAAILALHADIDDDDIAWVKPLIDEAEAEIAVKGTLSSEEVQAHFEKRRASR
jgi:Arc/MetJ-type ribon-helix-helix transcriptional regulator